MPEQKPVVVLLHGVGVFGEMGPWQEAVAGVLRPYFKVVSIKYRGYRWLGFLALVFDFRLLFIGSLWAMLLHGLFAWPLWAGTFPAGLLSVVAARFRYSRTLQQLVAFGTFQKEFLPPHVIAHSLGTHFVGTALRKYPHLRFGKIILAGSLLPTDYPWQELLRSNPRIVEAVRNDVGRRDYVPRLAQAGTSLGLLRAFGMAGWAGFDEREGLIHTIDNPEHSCNKCDPIAPAPIHNVICKDFDHSGVFWGPNPDIPPQRCIIETVRVRNLQVAALSQRYRARKLISSVKAITGTTFP